MNQYPLRRRLTLFTSHFPQIGAAGFARRCCWPVAASAARSVLWPVNAANLHPCGFGRASATRDRQNVYGQRYIARSRTSRPGSVQQLPAHPIQLAHVAPPETPQEGSQRGRRLNHTAQHPMGPPARSASSSSMQSPPANADATKVRNLSPAFARPSASPRSTWLSTSSLSSR